MDRAYATEEVDLRSTPGYRLTFSLKKDSMKPIPRVVDGYWAGDSLTRTLKGPSLCFGQSNLVNSYNHDRTAILPVV